MQQEDKEQQVAEFQTHGGTQCYTRGYPHAFITGSEALGTCFHS